jgi:hypothetical protein
MDRRRKAQHWAGRQRDDAEDEQREHEPSCPFIDRFDVGSLCGLKGPGGFRFF